MKKILEIAEFSNEKGEPFGRTLSSEWVAPRSVQLLNGALTICSTREYWRHSHANRVIRPLPLLDPFLALADASEGRNTLTSALKGISKFSASDKKICTFATRFGGLQIFCRPAGNVEWPDTEHVEYCEVWRYFASAMGAMLRVASSLYRDEPEPEEAWQKISAIPAVMRRTAHKLEPDSLQTFAEGPEEVWLSLAHFAGKPIEAKKRLFVHLTNALVGLAQIRPWFSWASTSRREPPKMAYSARSLLSNLVLQFCLRVSKVDAFLVCDHCLRQYTPVVRAPRIGYRKFCPECRQEGVPKQYASRDFKERQRSRSSPKIG
jgi:hypothetical protein